MWLLGQNPTPTPPAIRWMRRISCPPQCSSSCLATARWCCSRCRARASRVPCGPARDSIASLKGHSTGVPAHTRFADDSAGSNQRERASGRACHTGKWRAHSRPLLRRYKFEDRQVVDYIREATRKNIWYYRDRMSVPRGPCSLPVLRECWVRLWSRRSACAGLLKPCRHCPHAADGVVTKTRAGRPHARGFSSCMQLMRISARQMRGGFAALRPMTIHSDHAVGTLSVQAAYRRPPSLLSAPWAPPTVQVHGVIDENTLVWGQGLMDWLPVRNVRTLVPQIRTPEGASRDPSLLVMSGCAQLCTACQGSRAGAALPRRSTPCTATVCVTAWELCTGFCARVVA